jgi:hypothetical protein
MTDLRLQFTGTKKNLHKKLKMWCAKNEQQMTPTVMDFIKRLTTDDKFATNMREWKESQK